jgi:hypothetical protein
MPQSLLDSAGTLLVVVLLISATLPVGGAAASQQDLREKPDDLEAVHDGMDGNGTASDPYEVSNLHELQAVTVDLDAHYVLVNDIDARPTQRWDDEAGFEPIGDRDFGSFPMSNETKSSLGFQGEFDGNGHEIRGLWIDREHSDVGLFAEIGPGGTVENLTIRQARVDGGARIGVVAGLAVQGEIRNVAVLESTVNKWHYQGGIVGVAYDNTHLENVTFRGETGSMGYGIGGIVGWLSDDSSIHRCQVDVQMDGVVGQDIGIVTHDPFEYTYGTGGVVGVISQSTVSQCAVEADIDAPEQTYVGGLVGAIPHGDEDSGWYDYSDMVPGHRGGGVVLRTSYVQGDIEAAEVTGGWIGFVTTSFDENTVETGYTAASVKGGADTNPIFGLAEGTRSWGGSTNGPVEVYYEGGEQAGYEDLAREKHQMQGAGAEENLPGLDFNNTWETTTAPWPSYPRFTWEEPTGDSAADLSWRLFNLAKLAGEYLTFTAAVGGLIGMVISRRPAVQRRSRGLLVGAVVGLTTITLIGSIFQAITWALTGGWIAQGSAMLPPLLEGRGVYSQVLPVVSMLSQISAVIGAAGVSIGSGLWAVSHERGDLSASSRRAIGAGLVLMVASVGGRLLSVASFIVLG